MREYAPYTNVERGTGEERQPETNRNNGLAEQEPEERMGLPVGRVLPGETVECNQVRPPQQRIEGEGAARTHERRRSAPYKEEEGVPDEATESKRTHNRITGWAHK